MEEHKGTYLTETYTGGIITTYCVIVVILHMSLIKYNWIHIFRLTAIVNKQQQERTLCKH